VVLPRGDLVAQRAHFGALVLALLRGSFAEFLGFAGAPRA
jgi:hypothetical protein